MLKNLYRSAAAWTGLGLASGLFYRETTRRTAFTGFTQLAVAHTHALALGMTVLLGVLALVRVFTLDARGVRIFLWIYNIGLAITFGTLLFKGTLQVLGNPLATSSALAGIAGLGHMTLTGALVWFFIVLGRAIKDADSRDATKDDADARHPDTADAVAA